MATIEINGQKIEAEAGSMLIKAADAAGIYIPRFCYHDKLSIAANCRMCLVEVENAPKPLPACATPITDGMKVQTQSELARDAQKSTMEFLLINHPLDCPICDQGGECDLQDLAVGYGKDVSRFSEGKRVVFDKNIGSLISTDMTRCIQCTRCVRFGQEIAGVMELGMANRGEHSEIMTFMGQAVASEMSGNVIDLCPVGALTSKPFRFQARSWEMQEIPGVAVHDTVGSNTRVETLRNEVKRVLPAKNDDINEDWLSDRDRFSYTAYESEQRLLKPMLKINGEWKETDWQNALENVASKLNAVAREYGGESIGILASPTATLEEFVLLKKIGDGLSTGNLDYRLRRQDFRDHDSMAAPLLGGSVSSLDNVDAVLLLGSNLRKEQPILAARLRKAVRKGAKLNAINSAKFDFAMPMQNNIAVSPTAYIATLARLAQLTAEKAGKTVDADIEKLAAGCKTDTGLDSVADQLVTAESVQLIVGTMAQMDRNYTLIQSLAGKIAEYSGARSGRLEEANAVAAWRTGFMPTAGAKNALQMLTEPLKATVLFNLEPSQDSILGAQSRETLAESGMVIYIGSYRSDEIDELAHVMLPLSVNTESDGSHVNCEGKTQSWHAAVHPAGESRPGWKILRVLGNYLDLEGFDYNTAEAVRKDAGERATEAETASSLPDEIVESQNGLTRIHYLPIYRSDAVTRRADPLQQTLDNPVPTAIIHPDTLKAARLSDGDVAQIKGGNRTIEITVKSSDSVPDGCVMLPTATAETAALGNESRLEVKGNA
jgi:NADH-quinone oxidoreductase subunit G